MKKEYYKNEFVRVNKKIWRERESSIIMIVEENCVKCKN